MQSGFIHYNLPVMTVLLLYVGVLQLVEEFLLYLSLNDRFKQMSHQGYLSRNNRLVLFWRYFTHSLLVGAS